MENILFAVFGLIAIVVALAALSRVFGRSSETAADAPKSGGAMRDTKAERSYPITTIGIPPGHVTPSAGAFAARSYPITTIGIPPGIIAR